MSGGLSSRLIAPTGEVQAAATPAVSGVVLDVLDERCPRWDVALHRARPWRARAREGSIYWERQVREPRSERKTEF
jgi:hypothetical protein